MTVNDQHPTMTSKTTTELEHGDRISLFNGLIRTVDRTHPSGYDNGRGAPIWCVRYQEPPSDEWSDGNSWLADETWTLDADGIYRNNHHTTGRSRQKP